MSAEPWVRVTLSELEALGSLPRREILVWLAVRALGRNGWAIRRRDVERLAHVGARHCKLALARLEREGWIARRWPGHRQDPWGRFFAATGIPGIPVEGSQGSLKRDPHDHPEGSQGSRYTFQDPDRSGSLTRPSVPPDRARAHEARTDGRTDERVTELEPVARELWPEVARPAMFLERLCDVADAPAQTLAAYLRHAAQTVTADIPLAVACTPERWESWRRRRRRRREDASSLRGPQRAGETLSPAELAELADRARRDLF